MNFKHYVSFYKVVFYHLFIGIWWSFWASKFLQNFNKMSENLAKI
ncbi:hypothetical protein CSG_18960 [Campylobacter fetus subsp. venerealis str. 84-112]|nr:hypothetical protein CSG_18960 [Campylobacter fetus subsp. venerealis str. 84-112]